MPPASTRQTIVEVADRLFYEQGFESTSFAHIAEQVNISRGNFYYHFRTKDEILQAVIALRMDRTRAMLAAWEGEDVDPEARIRSFIGLLIANRAKIMRFGCPVGTLCNELARLDHVAQADANALFTLFREWLARQFVALGHAPAVADAHALHVLAGSQGVAALANAFRDEAFLRREVDALAVWLRAQRPAAADVSSAVPSLAEGLPACSS